MNGAHDMGGTHGFGPVEPERDEPIFHAPWERRAFGITLAMGATGQWNIDMSRFAREDRPPADYLALSYYALWLAGLERLMLERGLISEDEIAQERALTPGQPLARVLRAPDVAAALNRGESSDRPPAAPARFAAGERVRAKMINPPTHTRLPRYVRGRVGVVESLRGCHVFPDSNAGGRGEDPQWLYTVRFAGRELWGEETDPTVSVTVDAWEPYLEPT